MSTSTLPLSQAHLALRHNSLPALRSLTLEESDHAVIITGSVATFYQKQLAQESIMPFLHGRTLHNRVAVVRPAFENMVAGS